MRILICKEVFEKIFYFVFRFFAGHGQSDWKNPPGRVLIASNVQFYTATHAPEPVDWLLPECEKRGTL